jgi:hypothetical protein
MAKQRYRVVADDAQVLGHSTGEEFEFDFSEGYDEAALLAGGALELVGAKKRPSSDEGKES